MMENNPKSSYRRLATAGAWLAALGLGLAGCDIHLGTDEPGDTPDVPSDPTCTDVGGVPLPSFPLELGPTVQADVPPPAISGGTLALTADETRVVAADPDRDEVHIVDLATATRTGMIALSSGDEPGRVVVDDGERAHVALRSGGAVVTIDLIGRRLIGRRAVCAAPRGLAFDDISGNVYVACNGGELIAMNPATGQVVSEQRVEVGLRDVVVDADHIYISKFRTSEVLVLDRQGQEIERMKLPTLSSEVFTAIGVAFADFEPAVAWRMRPAPGGGVAMLHQRGRVGPISTGSDAYGGGLCESGVVHAGISYLQAGAPATATQPRPFAVLPVDFALTGVEDRVVIVAAGNSANGTATPSPVVRVVERPFEEFVDCVGEEFDALAGQPTAVAVTTSQTTVIQFREPAQLSIYRDGSTSAPQTVILSIVSRADTGHTLFHLNTGAGVACASCHPEGGDDARVWEFNCIGLRRTPALQFGLLGTEPFHWDGGLDSFDTLMTEVFVGRMGGGTPTPYQTAALAAWLDTVQAPPRSPPADTAAVERGRQLFADASVGCQVCHSGAKLTNNRSVDVGTGGTFQVPSLINIVNRAPFIHTGCAPTLRDRFTDPDCGGGDNHGVVSHLSSQQVDDLIAYLETL